MRVLAYALAAIVMVLGSGSGTAVLALTARG
jgi:hypothetical protein